jgi:2-C-methyl-D-erythritol 4-phosphate cytidylyltransferase
LAPLAERTVLSWTLSSVDASVAVSSIVVVCHPDRIDEYERLAISPWRPSTPYVLVAGGETRQLSVAAGIDAADPAADLLLIHDGARPLASSALITEAVSVLLASDVEGVVVGHPNVDTLKEVEDGLVASTPDRSRFWAVQTPQVFRTGVLKEAHRLAALEGFAGTDDASLVERAGGRVAILEGPRDNIKVTLPEDVAFAEWVLAHRDPDKE